MIIAGTGHRPDKIGGYSQAANDELVVFLTPHIVKLKPDKIISGMAQGFDHALARSAVLANIPFIAAVPCADQESRWPSEAQKKYRELLAMAESVHYVHKHYVPWCMQKRNEWMVNKCDLLLALFDGSPGGTANCFNYAFKVDKPILNLWDQWITGKEARPE